MTYVTLALLDKVDDRLRNRLAATDALQDHLIDRAGRDFLLAASEKAVEFEGVKPLQMEVHERASEDFIALIAEKDVDYSLPLFRIYADPFNTPSLVEDNRIADGFILKTDRPYDSPEDNLRLLRALKAGARIATVHRRGGETSAAADSRILLARCGPYHPGRDEILAPFKDKPKKPVKLHVLSFNVRGGKITVDNTHKPKTVKLKA